MVSAAIMAYELMGCLYKLCTRCKQKDRSGQHWAACHSEKSFPAERASDIGSGRIDKIFFRPLVAGFPWSPIRLEPNSHPLSIDGEAKELRL